MQTKIWNIFNQWAYILDVKVKTQIQLNFLLYKELIVVASTQQALLNFRASKVYKALVKYKAKKITTFVILVRRGQNGFRKSLTHWPVTKVYI